MCPRSTRPAQRVDPVVRPVLAAAPEQVARQHDRIRALANAGAVLHLGAPPEDEDSGMVAYMSRRHAARTVYWSATRGEGGQNRRGPERAEALGVVRTWESLDARRLDGGEVLYGPFYDFGFSKSGEDTLRRWGRVDRPATIVIGTRAIRPAVQSTSSRLMAMVNTTEACSTLPMRRRAKSSAASWKSEPRGRISRRSNVPSLTRSAPSRSARP